MALRGTLTHRKTRRLAIAMGIPPCYALGVLESLWHVTGEQAPNGAIGRMTNQDIAMEMFYDGDPEKLIADLITADLVDVSEEHRIIVHDWHIHSDDATDNKLARAGQRYASGEIPRMRRLSKPERAHMTAQYATPCESVRTESHKKPLPVPVPVPEPVPVKNKQKTSLRQAQSDPRHVPFKLACETYAKYKGVTFVWDGGEAKILASLLAASPDLTLGTFQQCLNHRARSVVTHGDRPREWLGTILKYQEGPLDQYGKPQGVGNGTFKGKSDATLDALRRSIEAGRNQDTPSEVRGEASSADRGSGVQHLLSGPGEVRPEGHSSGIGSPVIDAAR